MKEDERRLQEAFPNATKEETAPNRTRGIGLAVGVMQLLGHEQQARQRNQSRNDAYILIQSHGFAAFRCESINVS
jgi:hypothetical protein